MDVKRVAKKIMFTGGGTGGSVTPLLAIAEELLKGPDHGSQASSFKPDAKTVSGMIDWEFIFVGTYRGPERELVIDYNGAVGPMRFVPLVGGKFRRYFSLANFFDVFKVFGSWFISLRLLTIERPDIIVSAGSFVSVPLVWAAALKRIPILVHQQDARPGLANRLMAPFARVITVTFEKSLSDFGKPAVFTGNPFRSLAMDAEELDKIKKKYNVTAGLPLVLVTGGGSGAASVNQLVFKAAPELTEFCQVIHITGKGKLPGKIDKHEHYQVFEFLPNREVLGLMIASQLVISRCGLAFLTELSALNKAALLIPMPHSHQEDNAAIFARSEAAIVIFQHLLGSKRLVSEVRKILDDKELRAALESKIGGVIKRGAAEKIAAIIREIVN